MSDSLSSEKIFSLIMGWSSKSLSVHKFVSLHLLFVAGRAPREGVKLEMDSLEFAVAANWLRVRDSRTDTSPEAGEMPNSEIPSNRD